MAKEFMYYEEKIINGIICWRSNPNDEFKPYTLEQLAILYEALKSENNYNQGSEKSNAARLIIKDEDL